MVLTWCDLHVPSLQTRWVANLSVSVGHPDICVILYCNLIVVQLLQTGIRYDKSKLDWNFSLCGLTSVVVGCSSGALLVEFCRMIQYKDFLSRYGIPIIKIRLSYDCIIYNGRYHFVYAKLEATSQCDVSHWLGAHTKYPCNGNGMPGKMVFILKQGPDVMTGGHPQLVEFRSPTWGATFTDAIYLDD